jgi:thioredoxin reductase
VIPVRVLIVGAGLIAYGCVYSALKEGNKVFVADHNTEFGLPNVWPSLLHNRDNIPLNFAT